MGIPTVGCDNCDSTVQVQGSLLPASACAGQLVATLLLTSRFCLSRVSFRTARAWCVLSEWSQLLDFASMSL